MTDFMSASVPNPARRYTIPASSSLPISLEGLNANEDIFQKRSYILRHARALISQRTRALENLVHSMFHYERTFSRLHSKPLDTDKDKSEVEKLQVGNIQSYIELEDQVEEITKERAMIMETLEELSAGTELENREHTEWVLMPSMVWNLARLG
jgi:hypothetical protein